MCSEKWRRTGDSMWAWCRWTTERLFLKEVKVDFVTVIVKRVYDRRESLRGIVNGFYREITTGGN